MAPGLLRLHHRHKFVDMALGHPHLLHRHKPVDMALGHLRLHHRHKFALMTLGRLLLHPRSTAPRITERTSRRQTLLRLRHRHLIGMLRIRDQMISSRAIATSPARTRMPRTCHTRHRGRTQPLHIAIQRIYQDTDHKLHTTTDTQLISTIPREPRLLGHCRHREAT